MARNQHIDVDSIKAAARGRWPGILSAVGGINPALLDGRHHPCPRCGGVDRFRMIDEADGAVLCNQCFDQKNGDGIAAVGWLTGNPFNVAVRLIAAHLGMDVPLNGHAHADDTDIVEHIAQLKRVPVESLRAFGAHRAKRGKLTVCRVPLYDEHGKQCSYIDFSDIDADWLKGIIETGGTHGVFLAEGKPPEKGETVLLVEGVKDAAALHARGHRVVGLPTSHMAAKFARLFTGCHCIAIPDRDVAGEAGARVTAARLAGVAATVKIATLPGELKERGGDDVRDILAREGGEKLLRQAIEDARVWEPSDGAGDNRPVEQLVPLRFAQLSADYPNLRPPIIDELLRRGEIANIISHTKIGKSWLATNLLLSIATGRPWLDHFAVQEGRVLLIDNELHPETIRYRIHKVGDAMMIPEADFADRVDVLSLRGRIRDINILLQELDGLDADAYTLVVVDAWYRVLPEGISENDNAQIARIYNSIDILAERLNAGVVCVHHTSKGIQSDKRVADVGSGAGSQSRAADVHLVLREHQEPDHVVMDAAVRSWPTPERRVLRWQYPLWQLADGMDPDALKQPTGQSDQKQAARDREGVQAVTKALQKHGPLTRRMLRAHTGFSCERLNRLIAIMDESDAISFEKDDRGNDLVALVVGC